MRRFCAAVMLVLALIFVWATISDADEPADPWAIELEDDDGQED